MTDGVVEQFLASIGKRALAVDEVPRFYKFERDPKDVPYINLAIAAMQVSWLAGITTSWIWPCIPAPMESGCVT
jgi:hypothetical protein